jgi:hypothetical protein
MVELRCKCASNYTWTAAYVKESTELAAGGHVVDNNGFIQAGMISAATLSILLALVLVVRLKSFLFGGHDDLVLLILLSYPLRD